jgi:hypothetical protein
LEHSEKAHAASKLAHEKSALPVAVGAKQ